MFYMIIRTQIKKDFFYWSIVDLRCLFLVYSKVIQLYIYIYIVFHILFHYALSQDIEYISSSLCYTVGPCCLEHRFLTCQWKVGREDDMYDNYVPIYIKWVCAYVCMKVQSPTRNLVNTSSFLSLIIASNQSQRPGDFQAFLKCFSYFPFPLQLP